jgi:putative ABC transport system permease protein
MQELEPPRLARKFLEAICPEELFEEIEGDLLQIYRKEIDRFGEKKASRRFVWRVLRFFRPGILLRNRFSYRLIDISMLRNYLLIAFRNVAKNKVFSAINIFGLGIGLAACLLIFQFVSFELSYDRFNEKFDRIYRVTNDRFQNGKLIQHGTITYPTIGPTMAKDFPEIETYTRLMPSGGFNVRVGEEYFNDDECHFADEHFLSVFSFPLLAGDRTTALKDPRRVVVTEDLAMKYFNLTRENIVDALGKELYWGTDKDPYKVTGVCANVPENSHIQFDALISYSTLIQGDAGTDNSWTWSDFRHYVVLHPGVDYKSLESKFPEYSERYFKGDKVSGSVEKFYLQPLNRAHLYSDYEYDIARTASGKAVWAMLIISVFILVIAWINYINLTTSRALDRAKEVGLRKVMGAVKTQLVKQFIFESIIISCFAFIAALALVVVSQYQFNEIVGHKLTLWKVLSELESMQVMILVSVMVLGVLLSGFYPAFVLSSYQPITVLKGKFQRSSGGRFLRKALVIFQFTASAALITGTLIVSQQLKFMNEADLGMDLTNIMIVQGPQLTQWDSTFIERVESYKHELVQVNGVVSAATSSRLPGDRLGRGFDYRLSGQPLETHYTLSFLGADYNFFDTYGVSLIAGRKFSLSDHKVNPREISTVIINQNAMKLLGLPNAEAAIGKEVLRGADRKWTIIGVVNDFHQESLKKPMEPIIFSPTYNTYGPTSIKISGTNKEQVVTQVEKIYDKFFPGNRFDYTFMEDRYNSQYNDEKRFAKVISVFTGLGIIISCLGLIGLSSYMAVQRTKEIGIRKALGASLVNIIGLLSTDFMKLVFVAILLSFPLAYFPIQSWLTNYPYRIPLEWYLFLIPAFIVFMIAAATVSFQVLKTARTNPADTLKYE